MTSHSVMPSPISARLNLCVTLRVAQRADEVWSWIPPNSQRWVRGMSRPRGRTSTIGLSKEEQMQVPGVNQRLGLGSLFRASSARIPKHVDCDYQFNLARVFQDQAPHHLVRSRRTISFQTIVHKIPHIFLTK